MGISGATHLEGASHQAGTVGVLGATHPAGATHRTGMETLLVVGGDSDDARSAVDTEDRRDLSRD